HVEKVRNRVLVVRVKTSECRHTSGSSQTSGNPLIFVNIFLVVVVNERVANGLAKDRTGQQREPEIDREQVSGVNRRSVRRADHPVPRDSQNRARLAAL